MAIKTIIFVFIIATFITLASSAALTPGNLLVVRLQTAKLGALSQVYVDEITTDGTVVQTFTPLNCMLHDVGILALSYNQDFTAAAVNCFIWDDEVENNFPDLTQNSQVVAIKPDGTMDYTTIYQTGTSSTSSFVDGRNVWAATGTIPLIYSRRNSAALQGNAITTPAQGISFVTDIQYLNGQFLIGGLTDTPYFIASVSGGAPTSRTNLSEVVPLITANTFNPNFLSGIQPARFYAYSNTEIYATSASISLFKMYKNGEEWLSYSNTVSDSVGATRGLVAAEIGGKRMVFVASANTILVYEDSGAAFSSPTFVKEYLTDTIGDITFIQAPAGTCTDAAKNQDESDVDCGGYSCVQCGAGKSCLIDEDCTTNYCNPNLVCSVASCDDTFKNQDESDVDCGGQTCSTRCSEGKKCTAAEDCDTGFCDPYGFCRVPSCNDTYTNQDEISTDCGGTICPLCPNGRFCENSTYCESGYCSSLYNECATPICGDGEKNLDETDIDCGGTACDRCNTGAACLTNTDCLNLICGPDLLCAAPTCNDTVKNSEETDVDCGGNVCSGCAVGKKCTEGSDCESGNCVDLVCQVPETCSDNIMNQDESDVDCGGDTCSACADGKSCLDNADCESDNCVDNKCTAAAGNAPTRREVVSGVERISSAKYLLVGVVICICNLF